MNAPLHLDWETRSELDIRDVGMHVYCEHPSTEIWLAAFRFEGADMRKWLRDDPFPEDVIAHVASGGRIVAHNAGFERTVWNVVLPRQLGTALPRMTIEQQDCTMARALAMGLPGALELAAKIVDAPVQKDMAGSALMKRMAKPRKRNADGSVTWWDEPDRVSALLAYCVDDVGAEEGVDAVLPFLSPDDRAVWEMDQHLNERGIHLDRPLIDAAIAVIELEKTRLDTAMRLVTEGAVEKCSQRARLMDWLEIRGARVDSLAKGAADEIEAALDRCANPLARRAVEIYKAANRSSTAKLAKMRDTICADGRSRGTVQCHGAFTGRWAGRLWQPQNLRRINEDTDPPVIRAATNALLTMPPATASKVIEAVHGDVMDCLSLCLRSIVCANEGRELVSADYSNIEGRVIAWLAGASEKIDAFKAQDAGGADMYKLAYSSSFGVLVTAVTKVMRQIGKVQELALGYQGSIGAFINMAGNYGIKPEQIADLVLGVCTEQDYSRAAFAHRQPGAAKFGLDMNVWCGLKIVVTNWRESSLNSDITQFWWDLQDAALAAVNAPSVVQYVGKTQMISYVVSNGFLWCRLPTGKVLPYCNPRVRTKREMRVREDGSEYERISHSVEYDGWDGEKRKWGPIHLYGGLQANHVTQGTAAEIIKRGMRNLEAGRGLWSSEPFVASRAFPTILTVHDEAVSEIEQAINQAHRESLVEEYQKLMLDIGPEFSGLPLAAKGWMDRRYVK